MKNKILFGVLFGVTFGYSNYTTPKLAYEAALEKSPKIISAKFEYDSKIENIQEVYARLYPQLNLNVTYSKADYEINELQIRSEYNVKETSLDYKFNINQTIYDYSIYSKIDIEKNRIKLFKYDFESKKQELISEVLDIYMKVMDSKNKIKLLESDLDFTYQTYKLIQEKYKLDLVNKMDFLEADVNYQKIKISLSQEKKNYDNLIFELKQLTKLESINIPSINRNLFDTKFISTVEDLIKNENKLDNNLMLLKAKTTVDMINNEVEYAKSGHYPTLNFNASYTQYESDEVTTDYENYGKAMISLDIPLYKGGAVSSRVKSKLLLKRSALEDLKNIEFMENTKLEKVLNQLNHTLSNLNMYKDALNSSEVYLESVEMAYEKGLKSIVDLYEAKTGLLKIKYEYTKNIYDLTTAYVNFLIITNNLDKLSLLENITQANDK